MTLVAAVVPLGFATLAAARRLDTIAKERVREERDQRREQKAVIQDEEREHQQEQVDRSKRATQRRHMDYDDVEDERLE